MFFHLQTVIKTNLTDNRLVYYFLQMFKRVQSLVRNSNPTHMRVSADKQKKKL